MRWGIADFEHRFGRRPEGMWLPETAVDTQTLDILAREGIRFTVLSPYQAAAVRGRRWFLVGCRGREYRHPDPLPRRSGRRAIDRRLLLRRAIVTGDHVQWRPEGRKGAGAPLAVGEWRIPATNLVSLMSPPMVRPTATITGTGEMALAVALESIEADLGTRLTNYPEFLSLAPPTSAPAIVEDSSWSCAHGVERWRADCGCHAGREPTGHQHSPQPTPLHSGLVA